LIEVVLFIIADIYDDIDIEANLNKLIDYFHNVENTEEPLFYKSEEDDEKIKEVVEKYIEKSNVNTGLKFEIERLYQFKNDKIDKNNILRSIYYIIIEKIIDKIIDDSLYKISKELNKDNYDLNHILEVFDNASRMNIENNLIKKLKKYNYFFPDLNNNINENSWEIARIICKKVTECLERKNNDFEIFINKIFDEANKIGKYRIGILMQKYNMKLDNN